MVTIFAIEVDYAFDWLRTAAGSRIGQSGAELFLIWPVCTAGSLSVVGTAGLHRVYVVKVRWILPKVSVDILHKAFTFLKHRNI